MSVINVDFKNKKVICRMVADSKTGYITAKGHANAKIININARINELRLTLERIHKAREVHKLSPGKPDDPA
jgi:ribose 5-phosphate isomerase RpiB